MRKLSRSFVVGIAGACSVSACQKADVPAPSVESAPIVGGANEAGYPAVGALVELHSNGDYYGAFCTSTLIAPQWVLTAAHCLEGQVASRVYFYTGADANNPNQSQFHAASQLIIHEDYDAQRIENDFGLVKLTDPITNVTPILINQTNLVPHEGEETRTIGYGLTTSLNENTGGIKRSALVPITDVSAHDYWSEFDGTGTCYGDSGGPSLLQIDSVWEVVGITSNGPGCSGPNCDECRTGTTNMRVDAYKAWILAHIGDPIDCNDDASACTCAQACQANGQCDNSLCPATGTCSDGVDCWFACETEDCSACADGLAAAEKTKYLPLQTCLDDCYSSANSQQQFSSCVDANCTDEYNVCIPPVTGDASCDDVYTCFAGCSTDACAQSCVESGTQQAQDQFFALYGCLDDNDCFDATTEAAFGQCVSASCASEGSTCLGTTIEPTCTDADGDGSCVEDDCNDHNPNISPSLNESCDNSVDDNCNGSTDEGCDTDPTTSPTETTQDPNGDATTGSDASNPTSDPTNTTSSTSGTGPGSDTSSQAVGHKSDGCGGGGAEAPLTLMVVGLGLVLARRRATVGA